MVHLNQIAISSPKQISKKHNLKGQGIEKIIIPSNMVDIYTRLEVITRIETIGTYWYSNGSKWLKTWIIQTRWNTKPTAKSKCI